MRLIVGLALSLLSALCLTVSFAPFNQAWLIWVALVPMVVAQFRVLPPRWSALAPAIGVGGFVAGVFGGAFPERAAWYMRALPLVVALLVLLLGLGERARRDRSGYATWPLSAAISWVVVEFVRVPVLATWGFFGYSLYRQAWFLQPVRLVGIFGVDFVIVLVNYAVAMGLLALLDRRRIFAAPVAVPLRQAAWWCGGVLALLTVWCTSSLLGGDHGSPTVRVAALQPGLRRLGLTPDAADRALLERLSAQTREAARLGARLAVWPEAALSRDPQEVYADQLGRLARELDVTLVVGYAIRTPAGQRNEVVTVLPNGQITGRYGKNHPVTFLGATSIWRGVYPTVDAPFGRLGSIICYDMDFTDTARQIARRGARIIAVPSADWRAISVQHHTMAVFRALETGAAVIKSEFNRDSVIVDGYGNILASRVTPDGSEAVLLADVPLRDGTAPVTWLGDWVAWLCLVALLGRLLLSRGSRSWRAGAMHLLHLPSVRRVDGEHPP